MSKQGSILFEPGNIGSLKLRNKLIMTAIHTGFSPKQEAEFLAARAKGEAAACTAVMGVSPEGTYSNMICVSEKTKKDISLIAKRVHAEGGKLIVQLFHCGRNGVKGTLSDKECIPIAPSSIPSPIYKETPLEMTINDIDRVKDSFAKAASICINAGVDAIEISGSAGYLLSQFFSTKTNTRDDSYGIKSNGRYKFIMEVVEKVRESVGVSYPLILRVSSSDMLGGYSVEDTILLLKKVEKYLDSVNVTGGWHEARIPQISMHLPEHGFGLLSKQIKDSISLPVIACNRINSKDSAEFVLENGMGDFAGGARAFLCDENYAKNMRIGVPFRMCIACNKGCIEPVLKMKSASCIFNPGAGKEYRPQPETETPKKILIIGGGSAGMQAAYENSIIGHHVILCEKENHMGGLMNLAAKIPHKTAIANNIKAMYDTLKKSRNVEVNLNTDVDEKYIDTIKPDYVFDATGSQPVIPNINGIENADILTAEDVLSMKKEDLHRTMSGNIVIIGGGAVGLETAMFMSVHENNVVEKELFEKTFIQKDFVLDNVKITVLETKDKVGSGLGSSKWATLAELKSLGVKFETGKNITLIKDNKILTDDGCEYLYGTIVIASGYKQNTAMATLLEKVKVPYRTIGDAKVPGNIQDAIGGSYFL